MYVLFFDDGGEFAGVFHSKSQAMLTAGLISQEKSRPVVAIFNTTEGNTFLCFRYEEGERTFEAGCCPPPWTMPVSTPVRRAPPHDALLHTYGDAYGDVGA